jgi:hypothetical protein
LRGESQKKAPVMINQLFEAGKNENRLQVLQRLTKTVLAQKLHSLEATVFGNRLRDWF